MLLAVTAWTGCGEQASPSTSTPTTVAANDSAAAYAALSEQLSRCDGDFDGCIDSGKSMSVCESNRTECNQAASSMEADAEGKLASETQHCRAVCADEDAGPGEDSADAGSGDMNECLGHHAPKLPHCLAGLFSCLVDAGVFSRDASRGEIRDCVREANSCIVDELRELRERRRHHGDSGEAGSSAAVGGSGGSATASGGSGGAGGATATGGRSGGVVDAGAADDGDDRDGDNDERGQGRRHHRRWGWWPF